MYHGKDRIKKIETFEDKSLRDDNVEKREFATRRGEFSQNRT